MGKFLCPRCQRLHQEPDERIGEVVICINCQCRVRIPARRSAWQKLNQQSESRTNSIHPGNAFGGFAPSSGNTTGAEQQGYFTIPGPPSDSSVYALRDPNRNFASSTDATGVKKRNSPKGLIARPGRTISSIVLVAMVITLGWFGWNDPTFKSVEKLDWKRITSKVPWSSVDTPQGGVVAEPDESEVADVFPWKPPEGWDRSAAAVQPGTSGVRSMAFHATVAELPSVDVRFEFQRTSIGQVKSINQFNPVTDSQESHTRTQSFPAKLIGPYQVNSRQFPSSDDHRMVRVYHWYIPQRSIECTITASATEEELPRAILAFESSMEMALSNPLESNRDPGHQN